MSWHVYLIRTGDGALYAGITTDVERRFREHRSRGPRASKYLRGRTGLCLAFSQEIGNRSLAARVEHCLKRLSREAKEAIVAAGRLSFDADTGTVTVPPSKPQGGSGLAGYPG